MRASPICCMDEDMASSPLPLASLLSGSGLLFNKDIYVCIIASTTRLTCYAYAHWHVTSWLTRK